MTDHSQYEELLPLYAAGRLEQGERQKLELHLTTCAECRADLELWREVAAEVERSSARQSAPVGLAEKVPLAHTQSVSLRGGLLSAWQLLQAQASLVQRELWLASALVMSLGVVLALFVRAQAALFFVAPMVAAAGLAVIYGPDEDRLAELTLSTPTSHWKILLARMSLVSGYNLILSLAASLVLLAFVPVHLLGALILAWLGPLAFLSALALVLSRWLGTGNALAIAYGLWVAEHVPLHALDITPPPAFLMDAFSAYQAFWTSTPVLLVAGLLLAGLAVASAGRTKVRQPEFSA